MPNSQATTLPIPVTVIGGFLGSGKSSLLNHIFNSVQDRRLAVLVNDFGEINIDAKLVVSVEGETISLANGCVCCAIREDLLREVIRLCERENAPEHIVIESSGVARPISVAETFLNPAIRPLAELQNLITLLDADLVIDDQADFTDLAYAQVAVADLVVINKIDLVSQKQVDVVRQKVEAIVPRARIVTTKFGIVPLEFLFDHQESPSIVELRRSGAPASVRNENDHGRMFETWTYRSNKSFSFGALQRAVECLPRDIFRAKGIIRLDLDTGDHGILQVAGRRGWLTLFRPERGNTEPITSEVVLIGKPGATSNDALVAHFNWAYEDANASKREGHLVTDLRAFNVVFA